MTRGRFYEQQRSYDQQYDQEAEEMSRQQRYAEDLEYLRDVADCIGDIPADIDW